MFLKVVNTSSLCNHFLNNRIIFKERIYVDDVHDTHVLMKIKPGLIIQYNRSQYILFTHKAFTILFNFEQSSAYRG